MHKIGLSRGFLGRLLGPLLKTGLPFMKNVFKLLAKSVLIPSELTPAAATTGATIHKKMFRSGRPSSLASRTMTQIISNEEINDNMEIAKFFNESGSIIKGVSETIQNEAQRQEGRFLRFLRFLCIRYLRY